MCVNCNMFIDIYFYAHKCNVFPFPLVHKLPVEMNSECLFYHSIFRNWNRLAHRKHSVNMYSMNEVNNVLKSLHTVSMYCKTMTNDCVV